MKYLFSFLMLIACSGKSNHANVTNNSNDSVRVVAINQVDSSKIVDSMLTLKTLPPLRIISFEKLCDTTSKFFLKKKNSYDSWSLARNEIMFLLNNSIPISGEDHHHFYDVAPCNYVGELALGSATIKFKINAASFIYLSYQDTTYIRGCNTSETQKYFLEKPGID